MLIGVSAQEVRGDNFEQKLRERECCGCFLAVVEGPPHQFTNKNMLTFCCGVAWEAHVELGVVVRSLPGLMAMSHVSVVNQGAPLILIKTLSGPAAGSQVTRATRECHCLHESKGWGLVVKVGHSFTRRPPRAASTMEQVKQPLLSTLFQRLVE